MIDIDDYLQQIDAETLGDEKTDKGYQTRLFLQYVTKTDHPEQRKVLHEDYLAGAELFGKNGLRKKLAAFDLSYFGQSYLPHYFVRKSPEFHEELDKIWSDGVLKGEDAIKDADKISRMKGSRQAIAAPRGHAKSTNFTFKGTLHAIVYQYKHYPIIISDSSDQADGFLDDIKTELEENPIIIEDFGFLKGDKVWRTSVFMTSTGVKVEALGSGKKIRGRRHRTWRPDLFVLDDVENDENVVTPDQRRKLWNWFTKAVSKAGDTYTDIMYIGTVLHYDSLLANVLNNARYKTRKYQAVIAEAHNTTLWNEWERIYTNLLDEKHQENAKLFFEANRDEMLYGTEVLWEEKFSYYDLMEMRVSEGEASFNSEMQNEPIDPDDAMFNEEWFDFYEPDAVNFGDPKFIHVGATDPSLAKTKKSDTSSIFDIAVDITTGYMYIVDASVERRKPDVIIKDVFELHKRMLRDYGKGFHKFGVETVQFQYYFKTVMEDRAREEMLYIPFVEIQSTLNKRIRIESLQPLIKNRYIKFNRNHKQLLKQLMEYPMGRNDDAPDGLEMAVSVAKTIRGSMKITYITALRRKLNFKRNQLRGGEDEDE